jgi:hypothetical protein
MLSSGLLFASGILAVAVAFAGAERLSDLFICRGVPNYVRSDNGPEFTAHRVRDWLQAVEVKTLFIEPCSPWENGRVESFNGKLRDELLDREVFDTLLEAKVLIERWRRVATAYATGCVHISTRTMMEDKWRNAFTMNEIKTWAAVATTSHRAPVASSLIAAGASNLDTECKSLVLHAYSSSVGTVALSSILP